MVQEAPLVRQGSYYLAYYVSDREYEARWRFKIHGPEVKGKEDFMEGKNCVRALDVRHNQESGGSEGVTGKEAHC